MFQFLHSGGVRASTSGIGIVYIILRITIPAYYNKLTSSSVLVASTAMPLAG
jgi:hypothetical protein